MYGLDACRVYAAVLLLLLAAGCCCDVVKESIPSFRHMKGSSPRTVPCLSPWTTLQSLVEVLRTATELLVFEHEAAVQDLSVAFIKYEQILS